MPYTTEWIARLVLRRFAGDISSRDILRSVEETFGDARFDNLRFAVYDFVDIVSHDWDGEAVDLIAAARIGAAHTNPHLRTVYVAGQHEAPRRTAELLNELCRGVVPELMVFEQMRQAQEWIAEQLPSPRVGVRHRRS